MIKQTVKGLLYLSPIIPVFTLVYFYPIQFMCVLSAITVLSIAFFVGGDAPEPSVWVSKE